jgi:hypothetical protein
VYSVCLTFSGLFGIFEEVFPFFLLKKMAKTKEAKTEVGLKGRAKSGRVWKTDKERFSNLVIQKPQRSSWDKKMKLKLDKKSLKEKEAQMKDDVKQRKIVSHLIGYTDTGFY